MEKKSIRVSGFGEGDDPLGSITVTTDGSGNASFTGKVHKVDSTDVVTATATDLTTGDTSQFSNCQAFPP